MDRVVKPLVMALTAAGLVVAFLYLLYLGWSMFRASEHLSVRGLGVGILLLAVCVAAVRERLRRPARRVRSAQSATAVSTSTTASADGTVDRAGGPEGAASAVAPMAEGGRV